MRAIRGRLGFREVLELGVIPRTLVGQRASAFAFASPPELRWQVLLWNLLQQGILVLASQNRNLGNGNLVEPRLHKSPHSGEQVRRVDDIEFTHAFRVVILSDFGCLANIILDVVKTTESDAVQIENSAGCLDRVTDRSRACGESLIDELLVLPDEMLE